MRREASMLGGALQNALGGSGRLLFGFLLALLLGRLLGAEGLGIYMIAVAVAGLLEAIAESGPRTATVRYVAHVLAAGESARARRVLRTALALAGGVGLVLTVAALVLTEPAVRQLLPSPDIPQRQLIWGLAVVSSLPLALTAVLLAATRGAGRMGPTNLTDGLVVPVARIVLFLPLFTLGLAEVAALWSYFLAALTGLGLAWWFARRALPDGRSGWEWKEVVPYASAQGGSGVLDVALFWADTLIIAALLAEGDVGVYGAAVRLALIPTLFLTAFNTAFQPWAASLWAGGDRLGLGSLYRRVTRLVTALSVPFYLLLAAFPAPLLGVFGTEFPSGATVLRILAFGQIINVVTGPGANLLAMTGFPVWNFWNNALLLILNVATNFLLIPRLGIEGAAWAWAGSLLVVNVARLVEARLLTGLLPFDRRLARVLVLGLAGVALLAVLRPWRVEDLGLAVALGVAFGVLWLIALPVVLPSEDRLLVRDLFKAPRGGDGPAPEPAAPER
ncbi:MAG: flippase [Acidimicrobiia bacterium]